MSIDLAIRPTLEAFHAVLVSRYGTRLYAVYLFGSRARGDHHAERYLGLGYTDAALELMLALKRRALRHGGDFTLPWHNSHLTTAQDQAYRALMA